MIRIVGLGPSGSENMTVGAYRVICSAPTVFVRTARHPAVEDLAAEGVQFQPLDHIYESSETFSEVYDRIARTILDSASKGDVVYAVPGHPLVGESAVRILIQQAGKVGQEVEILGSESFIESSLEAMRLSLDEGIKVIDALSMDRVSPSPDVGNLIYQVYDRAIASDVKLKLMELYPDEYDVAVIRDAVVELVPLYKLDRVEVDHLTSVYVPARERA